MSLATVSIPDALYDRIKSIAEQQQISVDQFVASAVAEKMAAAENAGYLAARVNRANDKKYREALARIPDTVPADYDAL